jgi:hypothetical protein
VDFVDLCWLVMQHQADGVAVDAEKLTVAYLNFETLRRQFNSRPDDLLRPELRLQQGNRPSNDSLDRHLYNYIIAFRTQGADKQNILIRNEALRAYCCDIEATDQ